MTRFCHWWLLSLYLCLSLTLSVQAQSGNGALRGSVQDADFAVPVAGASVVVEGTNFSGTTKEDGSFFINDLPPGQYAVLISKEGFIRERRSDLIVNAGSVREVDLQMTAEVVELDEFVVSQEEIVDTSSVATDISIRTELKSFTDVLGQAFISQTGATDAAKLLAKSTGVNVAEGRFVIVRGLADRYNSVTLNGLRIPSSDPDRRAVALDLFPSTIIQDIRTSKTFLPDQPGEGTGASIDIQTKSVPDQDFVKYKIGTGYNSQATGNSRFLSYDGGGTGMFGTLDERRLPTFIRNNDLERYQASVTPTLADRQERQRVNDTLSKEMGTKEKDAPMDFSIEAAMGHRTEFMGAPAGITVAFDYSKKFNYSDRDRIGRYTFALGGTGGVARGLVEDIRRDAVIRIGQETMRAGLLVAAGIQPDENNELTFTYFMNRVAEDRASLQFGADPDQNPGILDYRESLLYTQREVRTLQLEGKHELEGYSRDLTVNWALSYNNSYQLEPDSRFVNTRYDTADGSYLFPSVVSNPPFQRFWRELYDQSYTARLDLETDLMGREGEEGPHLKVKTGGLLDYSDRSYRGDSFAYEPGAQNAAGFGNSGNPSSKQRGNPGLIDPNETWGDVFLFGNTPVDDPVGGLAPFRRLHLFRQNDAEEYRASQMIAAGYAMFSLDVTSDLNIIFGARVESTDMKVQASPIWIYSEEAVWLEFLNDAQRADIDLVDTIRTAATPLGPSATPAQIAAQLAARNDSRVTALSRARIQETNVLPALSVNWDITENQRLRTAISNTIARPSFKEIAPVAFQNVETGDFFYGNEELQMSNITNYDMRWEYLPTPDSIIGASFFGKTIDNPIEIEIRNQITQYINVEKAVVYGIELEYQRNFGFLTDELKYFNLGINWSYIKSKATRKQFGGDDSDYGPTRRLQGQPDYIFNANLTYEHPDQPLSGGIFLNVTGPQLAFVSGQIQDPDVFTEPYTTLDLGLSYKLSKYAKLTLRAQNLLNEEQVRYYNNPQRPIHSVRAPGINYSFSLNLSW
jgi:TonB-dependent receptor